MTLASLKRQAKAHGVHSLLAKPESNPKVAKNMKQGVMTFPLHLAPAELSGFNVCPKSTAGCRAGCLHTAGNPLYMDGKTKARIARTVLFFKNRGLFLDLLRAEIDAGIRKAHRANMAPAFRLNATSDIPWERQRADMNGCSGVTVVDYITRNGGEVYDYTKRANRTPPRGYHLTFSLAENNDRDAIQWLERGGNVAAVFNTKKGHPLPGTLILGDQAWPVIDGDLSDYRPGDPSPCIVGLRAKGDAIGDTTSGFVRGGAV
jgi:hypothetical protein